MMHVQSFENLLVLGFSCWALKYLLLLKLNRPDSNLPSISFAKMWLRWIITRTNSHLQWSNVHKLLSYSAVWYANCDSLSFCGHNFQYICYYLFSNSVCFVIEVMPTGVNPKTIPLWVSKYMSFQVFRRHCNVAREDSWDFNLLWNASISWLSESTQCQTHC